MQIESEAGGYTLKKRTPQKPKAQNYLESFMVNLGWKKKFVQSHNLNEVECTDARDYAQLWFAHTPVTDSFYDRLCESGMSRKLVNIVYPIFEPLINTCYSNEQLFDIVLDYVLKENHIEPLTPSGTSFYYSDIPNDTWVKRDNSLVYNLSEIQSIEKCITSIHLKPEYTMFFHCTSWNIGIRILDIGPKTYTGRQCLDFGISPSFYVTPNVKFALEWAEKNKDRWECEAVILIFQVSNAILESKNTHFKIKHFPNPDTEWKTLVKSSRKCKDTKNELDNYHFIYGPVARNIYGIKHNNEQPVAWSSQFQLAAKKEKTENYMEKNCIGSLWLKKP